MNTLKKIFRLSLQCLEMFSFFIKAKKQVNNAKYKNMWLISERGVEAKDNGYVFFKYLRENHPEINVHYVIDSSHKNDYERVKKFGNIIEFGSDEHKIAFILCKYAISTHSGYLEPWSYKLFKLLLDRKNKKSFVFLQHGIILSDLSEYINSSMFIDLFITTTTREYESLCGEKYGFSKGVVQRTGLARYDNLHDFNVKKQILLMPTWRKTIIKPSYTKSESNDKDKIIFMNSDYYKMLNSLINNKKLIELLEINDIQMIFYPHFEIQPYKSSFSVNSDKIIIADKEKFEVQELLKSSALLITDYSSVAFDFAYMKKPVLYYQKFKDDKYNVGYFDYKLDGFGEQIFEEDKLVDVIGEYLMNNFVMKSKYTNRVDACFDIRDRKNCERIYQAILRIEK